MNRFAGWLALAVCAMSTALAYADIAPGPFPMPPQAQGLPLVIRVDPNARVSRLILPPEAAGGEEAPASGAAPEGGFGAPAPNDNGMFNSTPRTIVAGLCLSLAACGLFFVTRVQGSAKLLIIGLMSFSALAGGAVAWADLAPGPRPRPRPLPQPQPQARIEIEWSGRKGTPVTLILAAGALPGGLKGAPVPPPPPPPRGGFGAPPPEAGAAPPAFDDVPIESPKPSTKAPR